MLNNTIANDSTAVGAFALLSSNAPGSTAVGSGALASNTDGEVNTALGFYALHANVHGGFNTALGYEALVDNEDGTHNTASGVNALRMNTTGSDNTAIGDSALFTNTSGGQNTALGESAGHNQTTGSGNVYIGLGVPGVPGENNSCYIASIFNQTSPSGVPVLINANNKLGTSTSSKRFKDDIQPMNNASQALFSLKPITFRYKKEIDPNGISQFGLVAEDVEQVNPDLVVRDKEGKPYSVRYDQVNAMLLNEFLKEHEKVLELESRLAQQEHQIECLSAGLHKVSAQIEISRPAPEVAANNQ